MCSHPFGTAGSIPKAALQPQIHSKPQPQRPAACTEPFGCWSDHNLALLSDQAESADATFDLQDGTPDTSAASMRAGSGTLAEASIPGGIDTPPGQPPQLPPPCDSEGLTVDSDSDGAGDDSPEPVTSGNTAAAAPTTDAASPPQPDGNAPPPLPPARRARRGWKQKRSGIYADLIGREVDVPAHIFDIQVPDLYYRAVVLRKDSAHPRSVTIRFPEDASRFWLPVDEVWQYIRDMEARRHSGQDSLAGERCATYAAEVLVSLSGGVSTGTRHSGHQEPGQRASAGGDAAESAMQSPAHRKRRRA